MNRSVLAVLHGLAQALVVGLTPLGAVGVLAALYLAPGWGLLLLTAVTAGGAGRLAGRRNVLPRRTRRDALVGAAEVEDWLRSLRGRAEGAE